MKGSVSLPRLQPWPCKHPTVQRNSVVVSTVVSTYTVLLTSVVICTAAVQRTSGSSSCSPSASACPACHPSHRRALKHMITPVLIYLHGISSVARRQQVGASICSPSPPAISHSLPMQPAPGTIPSASRGRSHQPHRADTKSHGRRARREWFQCSFECSCAACRWALGGAGVEPKR